VESLGPGNAACGDCQLRELVGLIPAGGWASRVAPLPCSKELFPIGFGEVGDGSGLRPKPVCQYLLEKVRLAGAGKVYVILREGKWDIPAYFGDGSALGLSLAYLLTGVPYGPPFTLDQAFPFASEATVLFGFPDIIVRPEDVYSKLLARLVSAEVDLVLGLFRAHDTAALDMVETDDEGRVYSLQLKPATTKLLHTWMTAAWAPAFTSFMHEYLAAALDEFKRSSSFTVGATETELTMGHVFQAALSAGLRVESVYFETGSYLDIGTPDDMIKAVRSFF
jgi:glucose-1-phosphate thymidylyltransferase